MIQRVGLIVVLQAILHYWWHQVAVWLWSAVKFCRLRDIAWLHCW